MGGPPCDLRMTRENITAVCLYVHSYFNRTSLQHGVEYIIALRTRPRLLRSCCRSRHGFCRPELLAEGSRRHLTFSLTLASSSDTCPTWQLRNVAQPYAQTLTAQTRERIRKDVLSKRLPELPSPGTGIALKKTIKMKHGANPL
jgi:hypothetical protein